MSDSVFDDLCKHGWLWEGPCAWCEKERLTAELDDATKWNHSVRVCKDHTADIVDGECVICELADALKNESHYAKEIIEKDKRIEELEETNSALLGFQMCEYHITADQIDAAWADAWRRYRGTVSTAGFSSLEKVGIVACEECGGGVSKAWDNGCPSCHGHGWIITSVDVDKYGRIGTEEASDE